MIQVALYLLNKAWPVVLASMVAAAIWAHGYSTANKKLIVYRATIEAQAEQARINAQQAEATLIESAKAIDHEYNTHQEAIKTLSDSNRALLAKRLQPARKGCLPANTRTTQSGNDSTETFWMVPRTTASRLVERHETANQINDGLIACQAYLNKVKEVTNGINHIDD